MRTLVARCCVFLIIGGLISSAASAMELTLDYSALVRTYAHANVGQVGDGNAADPFTWDDFDDVKDQDLKGPGSGTGTVSGSSYAEVQVFAYTEEIPPEHEGDPIVYEDRYDRQWAQASAYVSATTTGYTQMTFTSSIDCTVGHQYYSMDAAGYSLAAAEINLAGTLGIGYDAEGQYAYGEEFQMSFTTSISGDDTDPAWDWWVDVFRGESAIASLNEACASTSAAVYAGEELRYELYHVPEPASLMLLAGGALAALVQRRKR